MGTPKVPVAAEGRTRVARTAGKVQNSGVGVLTWIRERWATRKHHQAIVARTVCCDEEGISQTTHFSNHDERDRIPWGDVSAVVAYKQDCITVDRIWIAVADADGKFRIEFNEEDAGYEVLIEEFPKRLAGCPAPEEWITTVAIPAFKTNLTELYRRGNGAFPTDAALP